MAKRLLTNIEIADCLLRAGKPINLHELLKLIRHYHPEHVFTIDFVRQRLAAFGLAKNCICVVNKTQRPVTYHMRAIHQEFFRNSLHHGRVCSFEHTVIGKKNHTVCTIGAALLRCAWNPADLTAFHELHHA